LRKELTNADNEKIRRNSSSRPFRIHTQTEKGEAMKKLIRLTLVAAVAATLASALAIAVRAEPTNHANRLDVTFTEGPASITNRVADLGVFQLILTASGTLDGFGSVTEVVGVTQDRAVHPCGDGSDSESDTRRIVASEGTLALRETGIKCPTPSGLVRGRRALQHRRLRRSGRQRRRDCRHHHPHGDAVGKAPPRKRGRVVQAAHRSHEGGT
jgi:hypothetical protein